MGENLEYFKYLSVFTLADIRNVILETQINIIMPVFVLEKIPIPTVPNMNIGPLTEQKDSIFFAWLESIFLSWNMFEISFAPIGYPDKADKKYVLKASVGQL